MEDEKKIKDPALLTLDSKIVQVLPCPPAQRERSGRPGSRPPGKWVLVGYLPLASGDKHGSVSPATLELVLKRVAAFNASPSCCNQCLVPWTIQSLQTFQAEWTTPVFHVQFYVIKPFGWKYILRVFSFPLWILSITWNQLKLLVEHGVLKLRKKKQTLA